MKNKKYLTVLCDGMADYDDANGKTPMDEAHKPTMDALCAKGVTGLVKTVPDGMSAGSDVCNLAALGYDPKACYTGRSPLEALSMGIRLSAGDAAFRVNLVTLSGDGALSDRTMLDYSAGEISTAEASELINALKPLFASRGIELYAGISYRHAAIIRGAGLSGTRFTPPHDILGKRIGQYLPSGGRGEAFTSIIAEAEQILSAHAVNKNRAACGKRPATAVWFWGEGTKPALSDFYDKFGIAATVVSAVDLVKGIGVAGGMRVAEVPTATGTVDTDYAAKTKAAIDALEHGDYCFLHFEGPDECGHQGDRRGKITAIERIDALALKPLYNALKSMDVPFAISVMPDHATPLSARTHTSDPVPFLVYDSERECESGIKVYSEKSAARSGIYLPDGCNVIQALFGLKQL